MLEVDAAADSKDDEAVALGCGACDALDSAPKNFLGKFALLIWRGRFGRKEAKDSNPVGSPDENLAASDHGRDEFITGDFIAMALLIAVVEFVRQIIGIVGVKNSGCVVFDGPDDDVAQAV